MPWADQLAVRVVARASHRIGDQRRQQAVDGAKQRDDQRRLHRARQRTDGDIRQLQVRQAGGHLADHRGVAQPQDAQERSGE